VTAKLLHTGNNWHAVFIDREKG